MKDKQFNLQFLNLRCQIVVLEDQAKKQNNPKLVARITELWQKAYDIADEFRLEEYPEPAVRIF